MIIVKSNKVKNDQEEPFVLDRSPSNKVNKVGVREQSEQEWVFKCDGGRERVFWGARKREEQNNFPNHREYTTMYSQHPKEQKLYMRDCFFPVGIPILFFF